MKRRHFFIAGPCVIEPGTLTLEIAERLKDISERFNIEMIFKASFDKANRTSVDSYRGVGLNKGLEVLSRVKEVTGLPVTTDIHVPTQARPVADVVDVIQIPAFLCRQTDMLVEAAKTGKTVNIKKGQFMSPDSVKFAAEKVKKSGNENIILTDRGTMFGYGDLIVDFRSVPVMKKTGFPVVLDITHSLQRPNQSSGITGGQPELIETIGRAGTAAGVDGIFMETHPNPAEAKSDGANMLPLNKTEALLFGLTEIRKTIINLQLSY